MDQEFNTSRSSAVTEEERRLIDEAVAEGRVTKIPQGAVSIDYTQTDSRRDIVNKMYRIRKRHNKFRRAARKKQGT